MICSASHYRNTYANTPVQVLGFYFIKVENTALEICFVIGNKQITYDDICTYFFRGFTACVDAYLTPCIKRYLDGFCAGFESNLKNVSFMQVRDPHSAKKHIC